MPDPRAAYRSDPTKISQSKASRFEECRLASKALDIDGVQVPPSPEMLSGTVGHESLLFLGSFGETHPSVQAIENATRYAQVVAGGHDAARDRACDLLLDVAHKIEFEHVLAMEKPLEVQLGNGYTLNGTLDRVDLLPAPDRRLRVVDYKFGRWVPPEELKHDAQAQFYLLLAKAHAATLTGLPPEEASWLDVTFERHWVQLDYWIQGPVYWTPEIDERARTRIATVARELQAETEWRATLGPHCKRCPFVGSCPAVTEELARRRQGLVTMLPVEAVVLSAEELIARARLDKETRDLAGARYEQLQEQVKAVLDLEGPLNLDGQPPVDFKTKLGWRKWDQVEPEVVSSFLAERLHGLAPSPDEIAIDRGTDGDKLKKWIAKNAPRGTKAEIDEMLSEIAPKRARQHVEGL